jgi:hypothetical protein
MSDDTEWNEDDELEETPVETSDFLEDDSENLDDIEATEWLDEKPTEE